MCQATTRSGLPCMMPPMVGEEWCFSHHPDTRAAAHDARKRGGQRSRGADASPVPDDVDVGSAPGRMALVELTLRDTLAQPNCPARSRAVAYLVRLAHDMDLQAEAEQMQEQLAELHRLIDEQQQRGSYGY